jgi:polar amino acid transport system permease protein
MLDFDLGLVVRSLPHLLAGAWTTLVVSFLGLALAAGLAVPLGLARLSPLAALRLPAFLYIDAIRGTPLLVQIFGIYYVLPAFGVELTAFQAAVLALAVNSAAYQAEIWRGGVEALHKGQVESARSLGMSHAQCLRRIVAPQVARNVIPALTNEASSLVKGSSLVSVLAVIELTRVGQQIVGTEFRPVEIYITVGLIYLAIHLVLAGVSARLEQRLALDS